MKTSDVLTAGKALLENTGWVQNDFKTKKGYCLLGCLSNAVPKLEDRGAFYKALDLVMEFVPAPLVSGAIPLYANLQNYNDAKGRTKEDILKVLDLSIAKALESEKGG